jgi:hypothetical protein
MHDFLAERWRCHAWQRGGSTKLDSAAVVLGLAARLNSTASLGHGRASRHQCRAATIKCSFSCFTMFYTFKTID